MKTPQNKCKQPLWITGMLNSEFIIGRTFIKNKIHVVSLVTASGALKVVPLNAVKNVKRLTIIRRNDPEIVVSFRKKKNLTVSEKLIAMLFDEINNI